jgi:hypothetical protein
MTMIGMAYLMAISIPYFRHYKARLTPGRITNVWPYHAILSARFSMKGILDRVRIRW